MISTFFRPREQLRLGALQLRRRDLASAAGKARLVDPDSVNADEIDVSSPMTTSGGTPAPDSQDYKTSTMIYDTITKKEMPLNEYEALLKQRILDEADLKEKIHNKISERSRANLCWRRLRTLQERSL